MVRVRLSDFWGGLAAVLVVLSIGGSAAVGKTIHVKAGGTGDGSSWAAVHGSLQGALDSAEPNDSIWVAEGTYTPGTERWETFMMKEGVGLYGGFPAAGGPGWDERDPNTCKTILSGDLLSNDDPCTPIEDLLTDPCRADNSMHVMDCSDTDANSIIDGFSFTGGNANGSKPDNRGGGIYNYGGGVRINNCVFARNSASDLGGGVLNNSMEGAAFTDCIFEDNYSDRCGGAIYNGDWVWVYSEITLANCIFINNYAGDNGGALDNSGDTASVVSNCVFLGNEAGVRGGAISSWIGSDLSFTDCMFSGNNAIDGGAVANYSTDPNISKCIFVGNSATAGGGVYNESSDGNVSNCHFSNNEASFGGGGMNNIESHSTVSNCTFNYNSVYGGNSTGSGGGMSNHVSSPTVINCTFIGNSVYAVTNEGCGGGMNNYMGSPTVMNCTFTGNSAVGMHAARGGGMNNSNSNTVVTNCSFKNNSVNGLYDGRGGDGYGGGMDNFASPSVVTNCTFIGNSADGFNAGFGGGMSHIFARVTNCTFSGNSATVGGGIHYTGRTVAASWCILWGNFAPSDPQITGAATVSYSDIQGGYSGTGNTDTDPCFADPGYWDPNGTPTDPNDDFFVGGDYHLKSQGGRYDATTQAWVYDDVTSPCIDAGNPMSPIGTEPFPNGGVVNMGAYGGTGEASKSYFGKPPCEIIAAGDVNGDCVVDFLDFRLMGLHWCEDNNR